MTTTSAAIFGLWGLDLAAAGWAVGRLVQKRLWRRYPLLSFFLGLGIFRSLMLIHAYHVGGKHAVTYAWLRSLPYVIAGITTLILEWYVVGARTVSRRFLLWGAVAIVFFTLIATGIVLATANVAVLSGSASEQAVLYDRYFRTAGFIVVALFSLVFRALRVPSSRNHKKYGTCLLVFLGGSLVGDLMAQWNQYWTTALSQVAILASSIWASVNWSRFQVNGERPGPRPPRPSPEEMQRNEEAFRDLMHRILGLFRGRGGRHGIVLS